MGKILVKRVHEPATESDGFRMLKGERQNQAVALLMRQVVAMLRRSTTFLAKQ